MNGSIEARIAVTEVLEQTASMLKPGHWFRQWSRRFLNGEENFANVASCEKACEEMAKMDGIMPIEIVSAAYVATTAAKALCEKDYKTAICMARQF